jgi:hypothetical protein
MSDRLVLIRATPGMAFDLDGLPSAELCHILKARGSVGGFLYLPFAGLRDVSTCATREAILNMTRAGLWVGFIQHCRNPGWKARECSGAADGIVALQWARSLDPSAPACTLIQDIEGCSPDTTAAEVIHFAEKYGKQLAEPGLYDGYDVPWSPEEKWELPRVRCYFGDPAERGVAHRGYLIHQKQRFHVDGVELDEDEVLEADDLGEDNLFVLAGAPCATA